MLLVPRDTPGLTVVRPMTVFGYDDHEHGGHAELRFEDVRVPATNLIGDEGAGFAIAQARLGPGRIHHCMRAIGVAERAIELMCARVESRVAFGKPLARQGVIREWIAEARVAVEQLRLLVLKTAWLMDTVGNRGAHTEIQAIKIATPKVVQEILDRAIQVHGAGGLSQDFPLAASYAAIRTLRFADGPDEVHKASLARAELARQAGTGELVDLSLTEEQQAFRALARDFLDREAVPHRASGTATSRSTSRSSRRWPRSGSSGSPSPRSTAASAATTSPTCSAWRSSAAPTRRCAGSSRSPTGWSASRSSASAPRSRSRSGCPASPPARKLGCFGLTEPDTGSDAGNLTAQRHAGTGRTT